MVPWLSLLALAVTASLAAAVAAAATLPVGGRWWPAGWHTPRRRCVIVIVAVVPVVIAATLFRAVIDPAPATQRDLGIAGSEPVPGIVAVTDRGAPIAIRRLTEAVAPHEVPQGYEGRLIIAGGEEALSNCHGWVFAGGDFCVAGTSVNAILEDNGYQMVVEPRPLDLVIYRDDDGIPVHTGIVKATGRDRFVLVESKWGQLDVYWHAAADQGYADHWEYWRSDRPGHRLELRDR